MYCRTREKHVQQDPCARSRDDCALHGPKLVIPIERANIECDAYRTSTSCLYKALYESECNNDLVCETHLSDEREYQIEYANDLRIKRGLPPCIELR